MQAFSAFVKTLGATRIMAMGAATIALMAFFTYLTVRVTGRLGVTLDNVDGCPAAWLAGRA